MIGVVRDVLERARSRNPGRGLDSILAGADPRAPFADQLLWVARLARWVTGAGRSPGGEGPKSSTRLRFLLSVLERQPAWKDRVARTLRSLVRAVDVLDVYAESALPRKPGLWGEILELGLRRVVPDNPFAAELGHVLAAAFPGAEDAAFVELLDDEALAAIAGLLGYGEQPEEAGWDRLHEGAIDALLWLVGDVRTVGLSLSVRKRLGARAMDFRGLAFFRIAGAADAFAEGLREPDADLPASRAAFEACLADCDAAVAEVRRHLDEFGVSLEIVYRLDRIEAAVTRLRALLDLIAGDSPLARRHAVFFARLVRDAAARRSVRALLRANLRLHAKRLVDRTAETGEHYIARDRRAYFAMLRGAAGGGAVTALTTIAKLLIYRLPVAPGVAGFLASLNYSTSFVAIQLAHFTLATKQPASTAPALAARLHGVRGTRGVEAIADEIVRLIRSQAAGIFGNVACVVPGVLLIVLPYAALAGRPFLSADKAHHTLESFSVLGGSPVFAAITGVLLWASSLFAGGADNWFALRGLRDAIGSNPRLAFLVGRRRAERVATFLDENVAGLAGNVSLGVLLGMTPAVFAFLGLPLDVRHVTLASGQLAAAVAGLGLPAMATADFWLAVAGIATIGALNLGVSFSLALLVAIRARDIEAPSRRALRRALWRRLWRHPASFLFPGPDPSAAREKDEQPAEAATP